jgi:hypothetical protein
MSYKYKQKARLITTGLFIALTLLFPLGQAVAAKSTTSSSKANTSSSKSSSGSSTSSSTSSSSATANLSSGVTQSYDASSAVKTGMLVQLDPKNLTTVIPLTEATIKNVLGVVIPSLSATIVLTPSNASMTQVLVNNTGELEVLVSNQNGPIAVGDYLDISSLDGIAMTASTTESTVVGRADGAFNGKTNVIGSMTVKNSLGKMVTVNIARIPVHIAVTHNPIFKKASKSDFVPGFIGKIVFQVTSKTDSAARVYIAIVILFGLIILTANMLFGGIRGGMIAVGRQPLSKKSITISLIQTVFFALAIFVGGIAGIYMFLKI